MFKIPPTKIFFCYAVYQPLYDEMKKEIPLIEFHQGLPTMDTLTEWGAIHGHKIVVLDDLMMDAANSDEIVHLMCVGSHHHQITVIHILQNLFQKEKSMRTASLNCHYFILMANKRDTLQINTLGRQVFPGQLKFFMQSFELATQEKFSYLLLD
jgi:cobalamin biosynthesis Co2+ chelatase CbiK